MPRLYRNPFDNKGFKTIPESVKYVNDNYKDKIPREYNGDIDHFMYDYRNGPGKCQICGTRTKWDSERKRYKILCEPGYRNGKKIPPKGRMNSCQEEMRKIYLDNIRRTHGTDNLMSDISYHEEKLLPNRKIANQVTYKGQKLTVIGKYEEEFVKQCDKCLNGKDDLVAPGPIVQWIPKGSSVARETIVDFYIKSIDCLVSIKDEGFGNEAHPAVIKKRCDDAYKFKGMVNNKRKYRAVIELEGMGEIDNFPNLYKEIVNFERINKKIQFIKYPSYYTNYVK